MNSSGINYDEPSMKLFYTDGHNGIIILLEGLLIIGVIWLIFKKSSNQHIIKLTKPEEDLIIQTYEPDSLVDDVPLTHYALNQRIISGKAGKFITINNVSCLNFGSHNYLGFIGDENIEKRAKNTIDTYGVGSCGPRAFYGTTVEHLELEKLISNILDVEDSIVYSYGFATISSAIPAYAKKRDIIFVDEKRNFAIQKGLDASKSEIKYFKHNDMTDLENKLSEVKTRDLLNMRKARKSRRYLVVEGIYLNTGEICALPEIIVLCKKYKIRIFIDESISFGIMGKSGKGITEFFGIARKDVDLIMGSFEYGIASIGGFCAGAHFLTDHQLASGLGYAFSASLPPVHAATATDVLNAIQANPEILVELNKMCQYMHFKLKQSYIINSHFKVSGNQHTPIHLLVLRKKALRMNNDQNQIIEHFLEICFKKGIAITRAAFLKATDEAITMESVRITVAIFHSETDINYMVEVLEKACNSLFI